MDKSIIDVEKKCCGCGLCVKVCPFNAIVMKEDDEGFLYPNVDEKLCRNCGKCSQACIVKEHYKVKDEENRKAYMVINKNEDEYKLSASGGFATMLSKYVIEHYNGIVYGATLDKQYNVHHIEVNDAKNLCLLQGSKYVQSNLNQVFSTIKQNLEKGKVLFIGTPCQVDAIKRFVNNNENLITCDLVCHGVPSPGFFKKYLEYLSKKYGYKINDFRFRNKCNYDKCGFVEKIFFDKRKPKQIIAEYDAFYSDFIKEKNYRYSCYSCLYKNKLRVGDFTLGDVNSWAEYFDFYPEKATSLVIVNNKKSEKIMKELENYMCKKEISLEKEAKLNTALDRQIPMTEERKNIYMQYNDFSSYKKKVLNNISKKTKIKILLKRIVPYSLRIKVKKIKRGK